jgi:DNA-binding transcriptional MerR regulator
MSEQRTEPYLQIGEAADRAGLTQRTLRYYEEKGLLKPPSRLDGGFRLYSAEDMDRVERIKQLKDLLGFSLAEIKDMLDTEEVRMQIRTQWRSDADVSEKLTQIRKSKELLVKQLAMLDQKMEKMAEMRTALAEKLDRFELLDRQWTLELETAATPV